jgi:hypothetical protein
MPACQGLVPWAAKPAMVLIIDGPAEVRTFAVFLTVEKCAVGVEMYENESGIAAFSIDRPVRRWQALTTLVLRRSEHLSTSSSVTC